VFKQKLWCGLTRWLACEWYLDRLSTRLVGVVSWGKIASSCMVVRAIVFSRWQLCCSSAAALFGQLLLQQGGWIQFWMLPSVPEISSGINLLPCFGRLVWHSTPSLSLYASPYFFWVQEAPLGGWLVGPSLLSAFAALWCVTESLAESSVPCHTPDSSALRDQLFAPPVFSRVGSLFHPHLQCRC
jgi:hypothetical protein